MLGRVLDAWIRLQLILSSLVDSCMRVLIVYVLRAFVLILCLQLVSNIS